jgi:hypothetical protein
VAPSYDAVVPLVKIFLGTVYDFNFLEIITAEVD